MRSSSDVAHNRMLERARCRLLALERRLVADIRASEMALYMEPPDDADPGDTASEGTEHEITFAVAEIRSRELAEIEVALRQISEGTYGICEECGCRIGGARLRILPSATLCVKCRQGAEMNVEAHRARRSIPPTPDISVDDDSMFDGPLPCLDTDRASLSL